MTAKQMMTTAMLVFCAAAVNASVVTNTVNKTSAVGAEQALTLSLTGAGGNDHFDFHIGFAGPYPNWTVALTTGGDGFLDASQIAMADGFHALLAGGADVAAQTSWTGGNLMDGSSFFSYFGSDPNGWKDTTGYVGLRYKHFVDGVGTVYNYGWAEFAFVDSPDVRSVTLTRYAYETTANTTLTTPAAVPEPASVLMIGLGGLLIAGYRRFFGRI